MKVTPKKWITVATPQAVSQIAATHIGRVVEAHNSGLIVEFLNMDYAWKFALDARRWNWTFELHHPVTSFTEPVVVWVELATGERAS